jgi:hypothetical protein
MEHLRKTIGTKKVCNYRNLVRQMGHNWGSFPQLVHRAVTCDRHRGIGCRSKADASVEGLATQRVAATSKPPGCGSKS